MAINDILNISRSGLVSNQSALQVVSHNIANASTPGYSRQVLDLRNSSPVRSGSMVNAAGSGVEVADIGRQVDELVERRLFLGEQEMGRLEARDRYLVMVEEVFNEMDNEGLSTRLDAFFQSLDDLSDNPANPVTRSQVVMSAENLARQGRDMQNALSELTLPVDQEITNMVGQINTLLGNLATVNQAVVRAGDTTSKLDLMDQRNQMLMDLGNLMDINVLENANGSVSVRNSSGQLLLENEYQATLERTGEPDENGYSPIMLMTPVPGSEQPDQRTLDVRGGQLQGLLEVRDSLIYGSDGFLTRLESVMGELRYQVNRVHSQSVSEDMYSSRTSAFDIATDLDLASADLNTALNELVADGTPPDLARAMSEIRGFYVGGVVNNGLTDTNNVPAITFAFGSNTEQLSVFKVNMADPATGAVQSINGLVSAINTAADAAGLIDADAGQSFASISGNRLTLAVPSGSSARFGVVSDTSGMLAGLGVGAVFGGQELATLAVASELSADNNTLGFTRLTLNTDSNGTSRAVHDDAGNSGALSMSSLRSQEVRLNSTTASFSGHLANTAGQLGLARQTNSDAMTAQTAAQTFMTELRESISGVSLEEELTDIIKFQRSFQASSKMVTVADELMQSIIGMV
ncbi:MAG: flagellar hook-associated protein FlgK [Magnetococcus sp. WYHC-3]